MKNLDIFGMMFMGLIGFGVGFSVSEKTYLKIFEHRIVDDPTYVEGIKEKVKAARRAAELQVELDRWEPND
ncbi:hypothetical protein E4G67_02910 [Candidatus Bathyarchaeota archaeon]|nr:MAG: hypothetical protein E4G67_02910 [Candidatus Bathyarchaeota archaeon]